MERGAFFLPLYLFHKKESFTSNKESGQFISPIPAGGLASTVSVSTANCP